MSPEKTLHDLFADGLKSIYYAEKQILSALTQLTKEATAKDLRAAFLQHHGETEGQIERLKAIFDMIEKPARGKASKAITGLLGESKDLLDNFKTSSALDAGLIGAAQSVEHYEIAQYGTLKTWATELGLDEAADLLGQTLEEEIRTDKLLTQLATRHVNAEAA